jgi:hypothetical protein
MGEFLVKFTEDGPVQTLPNTLVYEGATKILQRVFTGGDEMSFEMGLAGPNLSSRENRPNHGGCIGHALNESLTYADVTHDCQEGAGLNDMMRRAFGYITAGHPEGHRPLRFNVFSEAHGGVFESAWTKFKNGQSWGPHGDWDNIFTLDIVERLGNPYYGGWYYPWEHAESGAVTLGYPWHLPQIKCTSYYPEPWEDLDDWLGWFDTWEDDPEDDPQLQWLCDFRKIGGLPLTIAFVVDQSSNTLLAYSRFVHPILWRPGSSIYVKYRGRIG